MKHVKEAFQLLNKSIIRVEQPDIDLDDDDVEPSAQNNVEGIYINNTCSFSFVKIASLFRLVFQVEETEADADDPAPQELPKKKLTLTFNEYQNLTNSLVIYMRNLEEKRVAEGNLHFSFIIGLEHYTYSLFKPLSMRICKVSAGRNQESLPILLNYMGEKISGDIIMQLGQ